MKLSTITQRTVLVLLGVVACLHSRNEARAEILITLSPGPIPGQTTLTVSGSDTVVSAVPQISGTYFNFFEIVPFDMTFPFTDISATGSVTGVQISDEVAMEGGVDPGDPDFFVVEFSTPLSIGETVTFSGSGVFDFAFADLNPGTASAVNVQGAPSTLTVVPEPATVTLLAMGGLTLLWRRKQTTSQAL